MLESREKVVELTSLEFDYDNLSIAYDSFSYGLNQNIESYNDFCAKQESFSFDSIITNNLFKSFKSEFIEFDTFVH